MKLKTTFFAVVLTLVAALSPICVSAETESLEATAEEVASVDENVGSGKLVGGALMLCAVFAASWVSMLIFRPRDKIKYL